MNRRISVLLVLLVLLLASGSASATTVRGRIDFRGPSGYFPMLNARVDLCTPANVCATYTTGSDGMFYLDLAPGQYNLMVNGELRQTIVVPEGPEFNVPPIPWN